MRVLVSGFERFGKDQVNPSEEIIKQLPNKIKEHDIYKVVLPVEAYRSLSIIQEMLQTYAIDAVLSIGQAASRNYIGVERIGININDFRIPDNALNQPINKKIFEDGADGYFSTLPIYKMVEAMKAHGINAQISNSAGTYVCNHVMYGVLYMCKQMPKPIISGFVHVPSLDTQVADAINEPCMSLAKMVQGICACIEVIDEQDVEVKGCGCID